MVDHDAVRTASAAVVGKPVTSAALFVIDIGFVAPTAGGVAGAAAGDAGAHGQRPRRRPRRLPRRRHARVPVQPLRRDELARVLAGIAARIANAEGGATPPGDSAEEPEETTADGEPLAASEQGPEQAAATRAPATDRRSFERRVTAMVGERDHDLERELIDDFLQGLPDLVATIRASWEVGDMVVLARAAHTLKSHAVMFGAARLEASCRALEAHASLDSNRTDLSELVAGIEDEVERVGSEVATF